MAVVLTMFPSRTLLESQTLYHDETSPQPEWVAPASELDSSLHRTGPSSIVFHEEENHA